MNIHNLNAIRRDIKFTKKEDVHIDIRASQQCCWNCLWSVMMYEGLWCENEMQEVDFRDLCRSWEGELRLAHS
jgi:hypothetical protein